LSSEVKAEFFPLSFFWLGVTACPSNPYEAKKQIANTEIICEEYFVNIASRIYNHKKKQDFFMYF
jgi:hypothetical protein